MRELISGNILFFQKENSGAKTVSKPPLC